MNLDDMIEVFRARSEDQQEPYLWSDAEIVSFANEAQNEACERAHLVESTTTIPLIVGVEQYQLPDNTLQILHAKTPSCTFTRGASSHGLGRGEYFDTQNNVLMVKAPAIAETLTLTVIRLPDPMALSSPSVGSEIHVRYHFRLLDWMMRCAYLKQDAETFDQAKADRYEALFDRAFGKRLGANVQRKQRELKPIIVKYGDI